MLTIMDLDIAEVSLVFGSLLSRLMRSELAVRLGSALEADAALGTGGSCGFIIYIISFLGNLWTSMLPFLRGSFSRHCSAAMSWRSRSGRWTSGLQFVWVSFVRMARRLLPLRAAFDPS